MGRVSEVFPSEHPIGVGRAICPGLFDQQYVSHFDISVYGISISIWM